MLHQQLQPAIQHHQVMPQQETTAIALLQQPLRTPIIPVQQHPAATQHRTATQQHQVAQLLVATSLPLVIQQLP